MSFEPFSFLWERLTDFLTNEFKIFWKDEEESIERLKDEVKVAQSHLESIDEVQRKADINLELQIRVQRVMEVRDEIEDFLDSLIEDFQRVRELHVESFLSHLKRKRSTVEGVKEMRDKLHDAIQPLQDFLGRTSDPPHVIPRRRFQTQPDNLREEFIVGLTEDVEAYVAELVPTEEANHGNSTDLAIFGTGGAGKTTASKLIYSHNRILERFDRRAWVCVSQTWDKNQLLSRIWFQLMQPSEEPPANNERLILKLKELIQNYSCFFVLDDVWEVKALQELLPILRSRSGNNGGKVSRVLVTTRNKDILSFPQNDFSTKKIRTLTLDESRDLLLKTIRRNKCEGWNLEGEFEELGKEMLNKCRGLPLAIVALGGILSSRDTVHEWKSIKEDVVRRISNHMGADDDCEAVKQILELSYFDLPYDLKPCFLYLGIFPEDSKIDVSRLIQLWIAEGFVKIHQNSGSDVLEKEAMDFLKELVHRCMVEIDERVYGGVISSIRIHDLMRALCIGKAEERAFFESLPPSTSTPASMNQNPRRIILHDLQPRTSVDINNPRFIDRLTKKRLRSYIMQQEHSTVLGRLNFSLVGMQYLRVLCLVGIELEEKSTGRGAKIGDFILLRHLELRRCEVSRGHALSIKKLRNLLSFIFECVRITDFGGGEPLNLVGGMQHLRHLNLPNLVAVGELGLGNKCNLQTLEGWAGEWVTQELPQASHGLRDLKLRYIGSTAQLEGVYEFFSNPCNKHIHTLLLSLLQPDVEFDLTKLNLPRHCASLDLRGKITTQPDHRFGHFPRGLLKLCLSKSQIGDEDQFKAALAELDELMYLKLDYNAYTGDILSMTGLPKLEELHLKVLRNLKEWRIESRALCKLQELEISFCQNLERLPQQISCISSLKHLLIGYMRRTFANRLQRQTEDGAEGEDFCLVRHIPSLEIREYSFATDSP